MQSYWDKLCVWWPYHIIHWGRDKLADIVQTTYSNAKSYDDKLIDAYMRHSNTRYLVCVHLHEFLPCRNMLSFLTIEIHIRKVLHHSAVLSDNFTCEMSICKWVPMGWYTFNKHTRATPFGHWNMVAGDGSQRIDRWRARRDVIDGGHICVCFVLGRAIV